MADSSDVHTDILVVGGGISGLYAAYRLAKATNNSVVVLECSSRFGGRFQTCQMPGGFNAELGAMRFLPDHHRILNHLVDDLGLSKDLTSLYSPPNGQSMTKRWYFRNQCIEELTELERVFSICEEDLPYVDVDSSLVKLSSDRNPLKAVMHGTSQLAKNVTTTLGRLGTMNAELFNYGRCRNYADGGVDPVTTLATATTSAKTADAGSEAFTLRHGMESIITRLLERLSSLKRIKLASSTRVTRVEELTSGFRVKAVVGRENQEWYTCEKLILACNALGTQKISWISEFDRALSFHMLFDQVCSVKAVKIFLTFNCKWWEDSGMYCGNLETDLPIGYVSIFGSKDDKSDGLHTILAGYTWNYHNIPVFEGLNSLDEKRFVNTAGVVPEELTPSQRLVDEVRRQLAAAFGRKEVPNPVCAIIKFWTCDPVGTASYVPRVGVDHNDLHWKSLKPFEGREVFIAGDTFCPYTKERSLSRWSESALLTSERILHKYFHLDPFTEHLSLTNPWPSDNSQ